MEAAPAATTSKSSNKARASQRAAMLMVSLGADASAKVFQHFRDEDVETLTLEIANLRKVSESQRDEVIYEFYQLVQAKEFLAQGGINYAKGVLEKAFGDNKANDIINRLTASLLVRPFDFVRKTDPTQLLSFIQNEHPQTIALVLAYLDSDQAGIILSGLSPQMQVDVARRVAIMERTSPDILRQVEQVLEHKLTTLVTKDFTIAGGIDAVVELLNRVDRATEKQILENLEIQDAELAEEIRRRMFVFEDIVHLTDRDIQKMMRLVETADVTIALKVCSEEVREMILRNVTKRVADMIREEMEFMGPVRMRDVEAAQQKIVQAIRQLEDQGEIMISRGGKGEDMLV